MTNVRLLHLPKITDRRGSLSFIETGCGGIDFDALSEVCWWSSETSRNVKRQAEQSEILIALSGNIEILANDSKYTLDSAEKGLYIPMGTSRSKEQYSPDAICLILRPDSSHVDVVQSLKGNKYISVDDCSLFCFPHRKDGVVGFGLAKTLPFPVRRVFYIYDIPQGATRGGHMHKTCHEILIAVSGSFEVELDDGENKKTVLLDNPACGLHIPPDMWAIERNFTEDAVCLVLTSEKYDEAGYVNSYSEYKNYRKDGNRN